MNFCKNYSFVTALFLLFINAAAWADVTTMQQQAESTLLQARYQEAIAIYQELSKQPETKTSALSRLANIYSFMGQNETALQYISQAMELAPESSRTHLIAGDIYCHQAERSSMFKALKLAKHCITHYREAAALDENSPAALIAAAAFLLEAPGIAGGDEEEGMQYLEKLKKVSPEHYNTYRIVLLKKAEKFAEATQLADGLKEAGLQDPRNKFEVALYYLENNDLESAQSLLLSLVDEDDNFDTRWVVVNGLQKLGESYLKQQKYAKAIEYLQANLSKNKNTGDVQYFWTRWNLAKAYHASGSEQKFQEITDAILASPYKDHKDFAKIFRKELKSYKVAAG